MVIKYLNIFYNYYETIRNSPPRNLLMQIFSINISINYLMIYHKLLIENIIDNITSYFCGEIFFNDIIIWKYMKKMNYEFE